MSMSMANGLLLESIYLFIIYQSIDLSLHPSMIYIYHIYLPIYLSESIIQYIPSCIACKYASYVYINDIHHIVYIIYDYHYNVNKLHKITV